MTVGWGELGKAFADAGKGIWHGYENVSGATYNFGKATAESAWYWGKNTNPVYNLATGNRGSEQIRSDSTALGKGLYHGGEFVVEHPRQSLEIGKDVGVHVLKQQLTPENIAINAALLASTVMSGGATAPAWMSRLGLTSAEGLEAAKGAETGIEIFKGADATVQSEAAASKAAASATAKASEFVNPAIKTSRLENFSQANQATYAGFQEARGFGKIDAALDAPRQYMMNAREAVGMSREGAVTAARSSLAQKLFPSVAEGEATGFSGGLAKYGYRTVAGGSGMADVGARDVVSDSLWRYGTTTKRVNEARNLGSNVSTANDIAHGIADPTWGAKRLAKEGVQEVKEHKGEILKYGEKEAVKHKDEITQFAEKHFGNYLKDKAKDALTSDDKPDTKPVKQQQTEAPPVSSFASLDRSDGGFVAPRHQQLLGTDQPLTTTTSTMPKQIGPSHWYGDNKTDYASGRGFRSPASQDAWGAAS